MTIWKVERTEWNTFCESASRAWIGRRTEIDIASLRLGAQVAADWLPLIGIVYDKKNDMFEISLHGLAHFVHHPRELFVDGDFGALTSLQIIDDEGTAQIIILRHALMLPSPGQ